MKLTALWMLGLLQLLPLSAAAGEYIIPTDIAVSLTADKTDNLLPGDVVTLTLTASNIGGQPAFPVVLRSSTFVHEVVTGAADCDDLALVVADGDDFFVYWITWYVAALPGAPPIAPGGFRVCHLEMTLTSAAPPVFAFSFAMPDYIIDDNPANDAATVILRRGDLAPAVLSNNAPLAMLLLGMGLLIAAAFGVRRQA